MTDNDNLLRVGEKLLHDKNMAITAIKPDAGNGQRIAREYFDSLLVEFRMLDAQPASTSVRVFGEGFSTPVMTAALSSLDKVYPDGMVETAKGAAAADAVMWCGIGSDDELKAIIDTGAKTVKVVKPYADEDLILRKLELAGKLGAFAVGMDIDFYYGRKNGTAPIPMGPKGMDDLKRYAAATKLPFVLKGVLSVDDAVKAAEAGADGIVVSHHGGAVLDYAVPPALLLPEIRKAVGGKVAVFSDCAITSGMDVFKSLALGADAVSVGKSIMAGLAAGGSDGVRQVIESFTRELERILQFTGSPTVAAIDPSVIRRKAF
jgi:L-lactate dehydrogenase (FMN-dependent) and related alpha-hydroxy acid dehydrogenases